MNTEELLWSQIVADDALSAATVLDRAIRGKPDVDFIRVEKFVAHMETVKGPLPTSLKQLIDERDPAVLASLQELCLETHDKALSFRVGGPFSNDEFDALLARSRPLSAGLLEQIDRLVGDVVVDHRL